MGAGGAAPTSAVRVPIVDLKAQFESIEGDVVPAVRSVLGEALYSSGPATRQFEGEFAGYCGVKECVALSSGTSALHLAMCCLDVGPDDEVVTVSMSFIATAWPILYLGARARFVDIDPRSYTMDPEKLADAITPKTRAIVLVHLYGQCADMDPILEIASSHGIPVVEDCAHAPGAEYKGRRAGSMGTIGCFSFYPTKNLGAYGEAGAVTTNDGRIAERARMLRDQGQSSRYAHTHVGYNYRMDSVQGAILSVKLRRLDEWNERRGDIAAEYSERLAACSISTPKVVTDGKHVFHLYVIRDGKRDELAESLRSRGVVTGLHYPTPIHLQDPFKGMCSGDEDLSITEELGRTCLSLPLYPELSREQLDIVVSALQEYRS